MANQEHLDILLQGVKVWNQWRYEHQTIGPDLRGASLDSAYLEEANLISADLEEANFSEANLIGADFKKANLARADLTKANLEDAYFEDANLIGANLEKADLIGAHLVGTVFGETILTQASIGRTVFGNVDLRKIRGLETVRHFGPSTIGLDTIILSHGNIPEAFLRGAGISPTIIEQIPALVNSIKPIDFYSCFISYASKNEDFARRLYADLQARGVRCWFAPEDLKIGDKFRHRIDESIHIYDKLLLVLSEDSLASTWVSYEVERALNKEPEGKPNVLFPIRLDKAILTCETDWAKDIRKSRHIGDFEHWKDHDAYQIALKRLLRDLKAQS